jgi:hypothetical protein
MPKHIYVQFLLEQPNASIHYLSRLVKVLNHFISIEPPKRTKGYESHHIVPKSWKPEWSKEPDNLLKVPAKAHYIIHHLMYKAFPKNHQLQHAYWQISNRLKQKITAKVYENLKNNLSHSKETRQKISIAQMRQTVK